MTNKLDTNLSKSLLQKAKEQSIKNLQYRGYLHKIFEHQNDECDSMNSWFDMLGDFQNVEDLDIEELMTIEKTVRDKLIRDNDDECNSEQKQELIVELQYGGRLYRLIRKLGYKRISIIGNWFDFIGLYTYSYGKMQLSHYSIEELYDLYIGAVKKILEYNIGLHTSYKKMINSTMYESKLITTVCKVVDGKETICTYISSIYSGVNGKGAEIRVKKSCCEI
ncbi:MAG: hypothetical protein GY714_23430 [Desulfobacterales bacterium]|nr:hypothetical protein [Desulfobacterales bacterium]